MKKVGIIILIVILISFTIALCNILTFAIQNKEWNWFMGFRDSEDIRKEEYIRKEENIDLTDIEKLKIELDSSDVNVFFTEESELKVIQYSYKELKGDEEFKVDKTSSNITIRKKNNIHFSFFYVNKIVLDVYIPKMYEKELDINAISGDIKTNDNLKFKDLKIYSTSGDIEMGDIEADNINIETVSGDIDLQNLDSNVIRLKTVSGDISVESAKGEIEAKTTSGDIEIEKIDGNVELTSTSGDIESSDFKITQKSTIKSTSGNVRMNINSESNCEIRAKSTSGNIDFPNGRNVMGEEPYIELNVQTTSGNIELK